MTPKDYGEQSTMEGVLSKQPANQGRVNANFPSKKNKGHCKATSTYRLFWCFPHSHFFFERPHLRKKRWRIDEETMNEKNPKTLSSIFLVSNV
uniref:Uncharacterized protein n=1 Tax=Romanomermis culicivorax TaxID=13658 RepID=A0A915HWP1_ROMCU